MEAWVTRSKILRDFTCAFIRKGASSAEALARTITVRPESSTILYTGDTFAVRDSSVPVHEPGAIITIEVETAEPLEVQGFRARSSSWNGPRP